MKNIKGCPFCKKQNITVEHSTEGQGTQLRYCECSDCKARGPYVSSYDTDGDPVELWNHRDGGLS